MTKAVIQQVQCIAEHEGIPKQLTWVAGNGEVIEDDVSQVAGVMHPEGPPQPQLHLNVPPQIPDILDPQHSDNGMEGNADAYGEDNANHYSGNIAGVPAGVPAGAGAGVIAGVAPGMDFDFNNQVDISDLEESYDLTYHPDSNVSAGIECYNAKIPSDEEYAPSGDADDSKYQPSNALINLIVNELEQGLQDDTKHDTSNWEAPRREGLRGNRTRDYSYQYGFMCFEETSKHHHAMMHSWKPTCGYAAALEKIKCQKFHYTNFLRGDVNTQQDEDPELDSVMPQVAHRVMLQLATKQSMTLPPQGTQIPIKQGLEAFGECGTQAVSKKLLQIHEKNTFTPQKFQDLTMEQRMRALESLFFLLEKRSGDIKGRMVADGQKQRKYTGNLEVTSPTVISDSVMLTAAIEEMWQCWTCQGRFCQPIWMSLYMLCSKESLQS